MKKPDFFIVGAAKSGTTALYEYLRQHPNVFMPDLKEPHFFAPDHPEQRLAATLDEYLRLFAPADKQHLAVGEASPQYLRSRVALQEIYNFNNQARIIIMLRNPADRVYSLHSHRVYNFDETVTDFAAAWSSKGVEKRDGSVFDYQAAGTLSGHIHKILKLFPRRQVLLIIFDDFINQPLQVYKEVLQFLEVPYDGRTTFPRINESQAWKSPILGRFLSQPPQLLRDLALIYKRIFGVSVLKWKKSLSNWLSGPGGKTMLDPELRSEMLRVFDGEIDEIARILDRDMSFWKK